MATLLFDAPTLDVDLFTDDSLRNPFEHYKTIRDAGPAARLRWPDVYALGRFAEVQNALRAPEQLISGQGIGFNDLWNVTGGSTSVITMDGPVHAKMRTTIMRPLAPAKLREARADLKGLVVGRVNVLLDGNWFNAMKALAAFLPVEAVSHLVGLPEVGRERMLDWAGAVFNTLSPEVDASDVAVSGEARTFLSGLHPAAVRSGSWAGELFGAVDSGRLAKAEAMAAISAYVIPSLDTTILAKGHLLYDLATHPDEWKKLRRNPEKIPAAVSESVRRNSVIRWFSRKAAKDYDAGGVIIPEGARVMLLYGCANRDERRYPDPDRFDIDRDARDQIAWGPARTCARVCIWRVSKWKSCSRPWLKRMQRSWRAPLSRASTEAFTAMSIYPSGLKKDSNETDVTAAFAPNAS